MEISKRGKDSGQGSKQGFKEGSKERIQGRTEGRVGYSSFSSQGEREREREREREERIVNNERRRETERKRKSGASTVGTFKPFPIFPLPYLCINIMRPDLFGELVHTKYFTLPGCQEPIWRSCLIPGGPSEYLYFSLPNHTQRIRQSSCICRRIL